MWQKARAVFGDQAVVFADTNTGRAVAHHPTANQCVVVVKLRQWRQLLADITIVVLGAVLCQPFAIGGQQFNIGALAR